MPAHMINSHGVGYDYGSVTHYGKSFFSKEGAGPTIVTTQTVPHDVTVGQREALSPLDIKQANLLYGCSARKSKIEKADTLERTTNRKPGNRNTPDNTENVASESHKEDLAGLERKSLESKDEKALKTSKLLNQEEKVADNIQKGKISNEEIYGELNLGHHYFEGDILLTAQQKDILKKRQLKDGLYSRGLTNDMSKLWPNGEVPYVFGLNLSPRIKEVVNSAIGEWNSKTCVQIRPKEPRDFHYIEFAYMGGCASYIGKVGNRQYLSVGGPRVQCTFGNIVHELGHALGFYHEHSRPDRDNYIDVNWRNIKPGYKKNFYKESLATIDSRGVGYDFKSIMHYGDDFFSTKKPLLKTIVTKPPGQSIGQRLGLSDLDIKQASLLYKCNGARRNVLNTPQDIAIATKKDLTNNRKISAIKPNHLKRAVQRFSKKQRRKSNPILKHSEIPNTEQLADPMIDAEDSGAAVMDSTQTQAITTKEKKLLKEITNSRASDINKVSGEENIGKDYFEGDMMLSNEQKQWFDSVMTGSSSAKKRALIKNPTFLWKLHNIPYVFDKSVDRTGIEYALSAIKHWEHHTCLHFPERKNETDYVVFVFEGGCSSRVGRVGGMQKINIGQVNRYCKTGNIIHEIGHALGFFHEQSRTDRDEYVQVIPKNVIGWYLNNFHKFDASFVDDLGVPYDYNSIMHYGRAFFSRNHFFYPTLVPLFKMIDDKPVSIGQRYGLSDMDILQANLLYHCDGQKRLTEEESHVLYEKTKGVIEIQGDQVGPCKDKYDIKSCSKIKSFGYCTRFPLTMRRACGQTCQLCGINPVNRKHRKANLFSKLKLASNHIRKH